MSSTIKYLSIKQWAGKAEKLRIIFKINPNMLSAEIRYYHFGFSNSRSVNYYLYFTHSNGESSHFEGTDWKEVYEKMYLTLAEFSEGDENISE